MQHIADPAERRKASRMRKLKRVFRTANGRTCHIIYFPFALTFLRTIAERAGK